MCWHNSALTIARAIGMVQGSGLFFEVLGMSTPTLRHSQRVVSLIDYCSLPSADRGFELDIKLADDPKLALQSYGSYHYDALILFAPKAESKYMVKKLLC